MTRRAGIYVRISEDRTGAGLGVERQMEDCAALAGRLGWQVQDSYVDNDCSAFSGKVRPEYRRLLHDVEAGRVDGVLAWHTDRLHRSPRELEEFVTLAESRKVATQTVMAGELDLSTPTGRMVARILGSVARQEVEHKADRTRRAHLQAAQQGRWRGGARPFGYESDGATIRDGEAEEVRRLYADLLNGRTLGALARDLNDRGVTSTTGKPWEFTTLRQMLLKPRNAGLSVYQGEVIGLGRWPALVSESTWRSVVDVLADPVRRMSATNAPRWLMAGLATCGACGEVVRSGSVVSNRATGAKRTVYRCRASGPGHVARTAEQVDAFVTAVVVERLSRPDAANLFSLDGGPDVAALEEQARGLRSRLEGLAELYADGALDQAQVTTATARLRGRLDDVGVTLAVQRRHPVARKLAGVDNVATAWGALDITERRQVVGLLLDVRLLPQGRRGNVFDPESVAIEWKVSS